jgi:hypothetical protein
MCPYPIPPAPCHSWSLTHTHPVASRTLPFSLRRRPAVVLDNESVFTSLISPVDVNKHHSVLPLLLSLLLLCLLMSVIPPFDIFTSPLTQLSFSSSRPITLLCFLVTIFHVCSFASTPHSPFALTPCFSRSLLLCHCDTTSYSVSSMQCGENSITSGNWHSR